MLFVNIRFCSFESSKMKFKNHICLCIIATASFLTGCATPSTPESMAVNDSPYIQKAPNSKYFKKLTVSKSTGGSKTNMLLSSQVSDEDLTKALNLSLQKCAYISDTEPQYELKAELKALSQPLFGLDMSVRSIIAYQIYNIKTGEIVFDEQIDTMYTAKFGESLYGVKRLRLANEGSVRNNIGMLIKELSEAKG